MMRWRSFLTVLLSAAAAAATTSAAPPPSGCGTLRNGALGAVREHREQRERGPGLVKRQSVANVARFGQLAVLFDEGDLALSRNALDLQGAGLRLTPDGAGFTIARIALPAPSASGNRLALGDDDSTPVPLPFAFPFAGRTFDQLFVNSDGNVTFDEPDPASTSRNLARLLGGPPRIAPLLADLDPSAGGTVLFLASGERFVLTWSDVPQWGENDRNTFQLVLYPDGRIDFSYATVLTSTLEEGVVGVAPGRGEGAFTALDLSATGSAAVTGAVAESFRADPRLDMVAVARRFYTAFPDAYDQLIVFTNRRMTSGGTFAYEQTVRNHVAGIGASGFDLAAEYGSGGRLQSVALLDDIAKYPADMNRRFLGEDSTLSLIAHEVGHRWLTQAVFRDGAGNSTELLGRDEVHWSFFFDTDGSHLEGNEIEDLGGGRFRTGPASTRYSSLDQYLMGLRAAEEVPPVFFVSQPTGVGGDRGRDPQSGVSFSGTRRDVSIDELVAAMGPRAGGPEESPTAWRQAWIFVAIGGPASEAELQKVEQIRAAWEPFFAASTEGRGAVEARID